MDRGQEWGVRKEQFGAVSVVCLEEELLLCIKQMWERKGEMNAQWGSLCGSYRETEVSGSTKHNIYKVSHGVLGKWKHSGGMGFLFLSSQPISGHQD